MNEFYTRTMHTHDKTEYEITFSTKDRRYFDKVEKVCRACVDEPTIKEVPLDKVVLKDIDDETFGLVEAFEHLIWGRKVRMTHWDKGEYIELVECCTPLGREYLHEKEIINQDGGTYPTEYLFDKNHIDARWEDYKEDIL